MVLVTQAKIPFVAAVTPSAGGAHHRGSVRASHPEPAKPEDAEKAVKRLNGLSDEG